MKRKIWLILAACLVAVGSLIFGGMMMALNWDFTKLDTAEYTTNEHQVTADFQDISVDTVTADLTLRPSPDGTVSVVCYEQVKCTHDVRVEDGALVITCNDTRQWYDHIGVHFNIPKITVYLPQAEYGKVSIRCTTGDIKVENLSVASLSMSVTTGKVVASNITCNGDVNISVTTGDTKLSQITCKNVMSTGSTGDLTMQNVVATGTFSLKRTTGDIRFDGCDAGELSVQTNTGSVTGTLLTEKVFLASTTTGDIDVPQAVTGGKCEIRTTTGDIRIQLS